MGVPGPSALGLLMAVVVPSRKVYELRHSSSRPRPTATATPPPTPPARTQVLFTDLFELKGHKNVRVTVSYPQLTGWMVVEGAWSSSRTAPSSRSWCR